MMIISITDESGGVLLDKKLTGMPLREAAIIDATKEYYNDPYPCIIRRSAVMKIMFNQIVDMQTCRRMPSMLTSRIKGIIAGVIIVFIPAFTGAILSSQKTPVVLYVFDTCGGCNVQNPCKPHMAAIGLDEAPSLPAILIGNMLISGKTELENLAATVKAERRFVPLLKQFLKVSGKQKFKMGIYDEKTVVDFSLPYCEDCIKTDSFLESLAGLKIIKIDPSEAAGRSLYERYCKTYGVPISDYVAPRLFIQRSSFLGYEEVSLSLGKVLNGNFKTIKIEVN